MSADLNQLLATARADADQVPLAAPAQLRQVGDRRTRRRRLAAVTVVAAVVGLATVGVSAALIRPGPPPAPSGSSGPSPVSPPLISTSPVSPSPSSRSTPSSPPARAAGAACRAADLKVESITADGGGGSAGHTVLVSNRSATMCKLTGPPALKWTKPNGSTATLPTTPQGSGDPVALQPGKRAAFIIVITNGFGGYNPSDPACANPVTYKRISAVVGGERLTLAGLVLEVQCDGVRETGWATVAG